MYSSVSIRSRILQDPSSGIAIFLWEDYFGECKTIAATLKALSKGGFENMRASSFAGSKCEVMEKKTATDEDSIEFMVETKLCLCFRTNQKL